MLIYSNENYQHIMQAAEGLVRIGVRYPHYVFSRAFSSLHFCEYEVAVLPEVVEELCRVHTDEQAVYVHLNPGAEDFWLKKTGHYGALLLSVDSISEKWNYELDKPSKVASAITQYPLSRWTGQAVTFGSKSNWCIYHDYEYGLSVIGTSIDLKRSRLDIVQKYVHDASWAVSFWKHGGARMSCEFYNLIEKNYSIV